MSFPKLVIEARRQATPTPPPVNKTFVLHGCIYRYTILSGTQDITGEKNWVDLARQVGEVAYGVKGGAFDHADLALTQKTSQYEVLSSNVDNKRIDPQQLRTIELPLTQTIHRIYSEALYHEPENVEPIVEVSPPSPTVATIEVDSNGRCMDKSLAYQILKMRNPDAKQNDPQIEAIANYLRSEVAKTIQESALLDTDDEFSRVLEASIENIPGEKPKAMIEREFYAAHIQKQTTFLDGAFLYVIPQIEVLKEDKSRFPIFYQCAVIQDGKLIARYPSKAEFDFESTLFIEYDGKNHYRAVDLSNETTAALVKSLIDQHHKALLQGLFNLAKEDHFSIDKANEYLNNTLQRQYPNAYRAVKVCLNGKALTLSDLNSSLFQAMIEASLTS
jgi:hypothetical protein